MSKLQVLKEYLEEVTVLIEEQEEHLERADDIQAAYKQLVEPFLDFNHTLRGICKSRYSDPQTPVQLLSHPVFTGLDAGDLNKAQKLIEKLVVNMAVGAEQFGREFEGAKVSAGREEIQDIKSRFKFNYGDKVQTPNGAIDEIEDRRRVNGVNQYQIVDDGEWIDESEMSHTKSTMEEIDGLDLNTPEAKQQLELNKADDVGPNKIEEPKFKVGDIVKVISNYQALKGYSLKNELFVISGYHFVPGLGPQYDVKNHENVHPLELDLELFTENNDIIQKGK